jgi:hypothetical protein
VGVLIDGSDNISALPRARALAVDWRGEKVTGVLLYGLRPPGAPQSLNVTGLWPGGTQCSPPWLLHGDDWEVDLWTLLPSRLPEGSEWRSAIERTVDQVVEAGYVVAWMAVEGDFADPPDLFNPDVMGQGCMPRRPDRLASFAETTGPAIFVC